MIVLHCEAPVEIEKTYGEDGWVSDHNAEIHTGQRFKVIKEVTFDDYMQQAKEWDVLDKVKSCDLNGKFYRVQMD